jgi:hypothetical protein
MKRFVLALVLGVALFVPTAAFAGEEDLPHHGRDPGMICTATKDGRVFSAKVEDLTSSGMQSREQIEAFDRRIAQTMIDEEVLGVYLPGLQPVYAVPIQCTFYP